MFVITDNAGVVVDMATEKANLSRGYDYPGYKLYEDVKAVDLLAGDTFDGLNHIKNTQLRAEREQRRINEEKIRAKMRTLAIDALKSEGQLP